MALRVFRDRILRANWFCRERAWIKPDSAVKTVERSRKVESWSNEGVPHLNLKVILRRAFHRYQAANTLTIIVCLEALTHRLRYGRVSPRVLCQTQLRNPGLSRLPCSLLGRERTFRFSRADDLTRLMGYPIDRRSDPCADNRRDDK
jgi:hypothetical protein